jgi:hypothetical protein
MAQYSGSHSALMGGKANVKANEERSASTLQTVTDLASSTNSDDS